MSFPQYRKHTSGKNFYAIYSDLNFTEIQLVGLRYIEYKITAQTYFEKQRIQEMLRMEDCYEPMEENAFEALRNG